MTSQSGLETPHVNERCVRAEDFSPSAPGSSFTCSFVTKGKNELVFVYQTVCSLGESGDCQGDSSEEVTWFTAGVLGPVGPVSGTVPLVPPLTPSIHELVSAASVSASLAAAESGASLMTGEKGSRPHLTLLSCSVLPRPRWSF